MDTVYDGTVLHTIFKSNSKEMNNICYNNDNEVEYMYIKRACEEAVKRINKTFPVLLVIGPRKTGKHTMLKHLAEKERTIVSLNDLHIRFLAQQDPVLFFQRYQPPLLIDEIQYAPQLLPYIKMQVD